MRAKSALAAANGGMRGGCSSDVHPVQELDATRRKTGFQRSVSQYRWSAASRFGRRSVITDFARFINSEFALLRGWQGAATRRDLLVGSGGTYEETARRLEGGLVGRALHLPQRAALEPLDPSSGDAL